MREIKFRLWNEDTKRMTSVENLFIDAYYESDDGCLVNKWLNRPNKIFLQYTGLKDKNGKEIYEGDIVKHNDYTGKYIVTFQKGKYIMGTMTIYLWELTEIIGNIWENPELLEAK